MNNNSREKILKILFDKPTEKFHIREIAEITKLNPNTVLNMLKIFEKENLINRIKKKYIVEISVNINEKFRRKKRLDNLDRLYTSGIVDFLMEEFSSEAISVVGSYSTGEDIENSDIDLVVISKKEKELDLSKFEKALSRKIHLIVTDYKSMSEEFYINLINGIILGGYIDKK